MRRHGKRIIIIVICVLAALMLILKICWPSSESQLIEKASKIVGLNIPYEEVINYYEEEGNAFGKQNHIVLLKINKNDRETINNLLKDHGAITLPIQNYLENGIIDLFEDESKPSLISEDVLKSGKMLFYNKNEKHFCSIEELESGYGNMNNGTFDGFVILIYQDNNDLMYLLFHS